MNTELFPKKWQEIEQEHYNYLVMQGHCPKCLAHPHTLPDLMEHHQDCPAYRVPQKHTMGNNI